MNVGDLSKIRTVFIINDASVPVGYRDVPIVFVKKYDYLNNDIPYSEVRVFGKKGSHYIKVPSISPITVIEDSSIVKEYDDYLLDTLHCNLNNAVEVGSDPEIFLEKENGEILPSFDFLSSKEHCKDFGAASDGRTPKECGTRKIYWDGYQAEFETYPSSCLSWQVDSVQLGLKGLLQAVKKYDPTAKLSMKTLMEISQESRMQAKEEHVQFGCMPSFNAYGIKGRSEHGRDVPFRSAGGHIHIGFAHDNHKPDRMVRIIKAMDAILGVACVSLFAGYDDPRRRQMYGLAGEYRTPKHGLEYRVLSNAWLCHPMIMHLVFDLARKSFMMGDKDNMHFWKATEEETINCINNCDVAKAREILERNKKVFIKVLSSCYKYVGDGKSPEQVFNIFMNGIDYAVANPKDIVGNWCLEAPWAAHSDGVGKNWNSAYGIIRQGSKVA